MPIALLCFASLGFAEVSHAALPTIPPPECSAKEIATWNGAGWECVNPLHRQRVTVGIESFKSLKLPEKIRSVAVRDEETVGARKVSDTEVLLLGLREGETGLTIVLESGDRATYRVRAMQRDDGGCAASPLCQRVSQVRDELGDMEGVFVVTRARNVYLDGSPQTKEDAEKLRKLLIEFPGLRRLGADEQKADQRKRLSSDGGTEP